MRNLIETPSKQLKQFLFSQYFSDGLRITLGILLPSIICFQVGYINIGITLSLGALCVSIPDNPGSARHRINAMLVTMVLLFFTALVTGLLVPYTWPLAIWIFCSCFLFSMLNVFGARAAAVGVSLLVIMVLGIDQQLTPKEVLEYSLLAFAGGAWYFLLSLFSQRLMPYRPAEQMLGECVMEVASFVRLKAGFYNTQTDIDEQYKELLEQQALVHQYQDNVRDILFRTRRLINDSSNTGQRLLLTFVDLVDLHEEVMATQYNYKDIQEQFASSGVLPSFEKVILQLADELENVGTGLHNHEHTSPLYDLQRELMLLKEKVDIVEAKGQNALVLKRVLINLRNIFQRIQRMYEYETKVDQLSEQRTKELPRFVDRQVIDWNLFRANLSLHSSHFRHAIRVAVVCLVAFVFTKTISEGAHSYWILLTIIVILKPGYSLTKQRNYERVVGTIAGGLLGLIILFVFPSPTVRFVFLMVFMLLAFSFIRVRYVVSVLFMTPYILIVFSFTGNINEITVAWERIIDTFIGAMAAVLGSYFVLPSWESYQLKPVVVKMLQANANYLKRIVERTLSNPETESAYRLARKEVYVQSAGLTTAFQRMLTEPKSKQQQADLLYRFLVLNHQFSSYLATLSELLKHTDQLSEEQVRILRSAWYSLKESYEKLSGKQANAELTKLFSPHDAEELSAEFLYTIQQTANDIRKISLQFSF